MMRAHVLYLILVHPDETRSMIPVNWTDLPVSSVEHSERKNMRGISLSHIASLNDLIVLRQKVDFLLQRAITIRKEKADACGTNDSHGSHGTGDGGKAALETT
jgi:hypothetical protein